MTDEKLIGWTSIQVPLPARDQEGSPQFGAYPKVLRTRQQHMDENNQKWEEEELP